MRWRAALFLTLAGTLGHPAELMTGAVVSYYLKRNGVWEFKDQDRLWIGE